MAFLYSKWETGIIATGDSGPQAVSALEHSSGRETLRELLLEIPGFQVLVEKVIPVGLLSPLPQSGDPACEPGHSVGSAVAV